MNEIIAKIVEEVGGGDEPCNEPVDPSVVNSSYFKLDESSAIDTVQKFINEGIGVDGVNDGIQCVAEIVEEAGILEGELWNYTAQGLFVSVKDLRFGRPLGNFYDLKVRVRGSGGLRIVEGNGLFFTNVMCTSGHLPGNRPLSPP